jgi:hypothetical protein
MRGAAPAPAPVPERSGAWAWLRGAQAAPPLQTSGEDGRAREPPGGVSHPDLEARGHTAARAQAVVGTLLGVYKRRVRGGTGWSCMRWRAACARPRTTPRSAA